MDDMDSACAAFQARLDTFLAPKTKSRRTSARSKKAAPKGAQKPAWPLQYPRPEDLAYAGFIYKPTSASNDNVQCFSCRTQLDGWEETDTPAYEHLTHSPNCGFAINVAIRLRNGDPGRTEDDPMSEHMLEARRITFVDLWPLDASQGFPKIEQMAYAGWYYDPSDDTPDGVTCAYCCLSLDAWDAGDDPMEEHRRRSPDCLFFSLKEFYHPTKKPKATRGKRSSSMSSTASRKGTKATRSKKAATKKTAAKEDLSKPLPPTPDDVPESFAESFADSVASASTKAPAKGRKTKKTATKRASTVSNASSTRTTRRNKRTSEVLDDYEEPKPSPKRTKVSNVSSGLPESVLGSTPDQSLSDPSLQPRKILSPVAPRAKTPESVASPSNPMSSLTPGFGFASTPKHSEVATPKQNTPQKSWEPVNIDAFFENPEGMAGIISNILVDAGLDKENIDIDMGGTPEALAKAIQAGITAQEKAMTIEEWVLYNAKRGEEKLRTACERQIAAFEAEGRRALATLHALPTV